MTYKINWIKTWKALSTHFIVTIVLGITFIEISKYVGGGFSSDANFQRVSFGESVLVVIAICAAGSILMFFIAMCMALYKININNNAISGRNIYFIKRTIPFSDIASIESYSINGVTGVEVTSKINGGIFIPVQTKDFETLINILMNNAGIQKIT